MSNAAETQEAPTSTIVEPPPPYQSELAPEFAHEAAPEPESEPETEPATVLFEQPEAFEQEPVVEVLDAPTGLEPAPEPSRRESQVLPTLVLVPESTHESEPGNPEAMQPEVAAVVPASMPASVPVLSTVAIASEPSVSQITSKSATVPASIPAPGPTMVAIIGESSASQAAVNAIKADPKVALETPSILGPPIKEAVGSNQASQTTRDAIEHVQDTADMPIASLDSPSPPQTAPGDSIASHGSMPEPNSAPQELKMSSSPETPPEHEPSVKEAEVAPAPEVSPSVVSTANTNLSTSQKIRRRVADRFAVLRCPKEVAPIAIHLSQKKKEGEDLNPIVDTMMKAVGAQDSRQNI